MEHYLDNSATTKPMEAALEAMNRAALVWGNPSSVHSLGQSAAALLKESRLTIAKTLGLQRFSKDRIIFTASGTEADNIAILGCAHSKNRNKEHPGTVIISEGEHPAVDLPALQLEKEGYCLIKVPTKGGVLDLGFLEKAVNEAEYPVVVASFMLVNNETGALYDVKSAARIVKRKYPDALVHCDAVQGYMKVKFTPASLGVDALTVSAHKIHSLRGAAALYISEETIKRKNIVPVMPGGGQEGGFRSGTENLVSIAAFAAAADNMYSNFDTYSEKVSGLREYLEEKLSECPDVRINRPEEKYIPHICNITVKGIRSETMLNSLSAKGVYVSAGSACAANSKKKSAALQAFGITPDDSDSSLRISMSFANTTDDIDALADGLREGIAGLQKKR